MKKKYKLALLFLCLLFSNLLICQERNLNNDLSSKTPPTLNSANISGRTVKKSTSIASQNSIRYASTNSSSDQNRLPYCEPYFSNCSDYIEKLIFAGINNDSECQLGLNDYTDQVGLVVTGDTYTISVRTHALSSQYVFAYIDWNQNGQLDDAGEIYEIAIAIHNNGPHTKAIDIPEDAVLGETRMRVIMQWNNANTDPCIVYGTGEAEDYTLNVVDEIPIVPKDCSQWVPSSDNAGGHFFIGQTNQKLAIDIDILPESSFEITTVKIQTLGQATTFDLVFYDNVDGLPGMPFNTLNDVSILEEEYLGTGIDYDYYIYTLDISADNILFEGQQQGRKVWMEVVSNATGWNNTNNTTLGNLGAFFNDNTEDWRLSEVEYVYELIGICLGDEIQDLPNDACSNALPIVCGNQVTGTTVGAEDFGGNASPDVFYSYTGSGQEENIALSLCIGTEYDTVIRVFTDCSLSNEIAYNDNFCFGRSVVDFVSDGISTYYIMIEGGGVTDVGDFTLYASCSSMPSPNTTPDLAASVECGDRILGNTVNAENNAGNASGDVFFKYQGNGIAEDITVSLCSVFTSYDTEIRVYDDINLTNEIASVDDSCGTFSELTFFSDGIKTYYIMIEGSDNEEGNYGLYLSCWDNTAYCSPLNFVYIEPITNVEIAGISHRSSAAPTSPPHEVFTDITGTMVLEESYDITLEGFTGSDGAWENFFTVFIDWNQNNIFNDPGEMFEIGSIFNSTGEDGIQLEGAISVPNNATLGTTVMRVLKGYNESPQDPCADYGYGQVEDYSITILSVLGTEEVAKNSISSYPNPVEDIITIESDKFLSKIVIYDISGKIILEVSPQQDKIKLDLSFLSSGIYMAKAITDEEVQTLKIIKK